MFRNKLQHIKQMIHGKNTLRNMMKCYKQYSVDPPLIKGGGGGGGANGYFFVKLDFEIAVDQQTKTSDRNFEGVPDPNRQTVPAGQPRPYLVQIRPNLAKYPEHAPYPYFMCSSCS